MDKRNFRFIWIIISLLMIKEGNNTDTYQLKHVYAKYGDSVILKCLNNTDSTVWDGPSTKSSYTSYKHNRIPYAGKDKIVQQLPNAKNFKVVGDVSLGEYNLKIINLTQNEEGYYQCHALRGTTTFEISYVLKIKEPPKNLMTNGKNGTLVCKAGEEMRINCTVIRGVPENETKIYLHFNDDIIKESLTGTLIYSFIPRGDNNGDTFKCAVRNLLLDIPLEETIRLNVTDRPTVRFDKNEHNITVYEGRPFSITCFSDSYPVTTEIFWKTNGKMIGRDTQFKKSVTLNIARIERHHGGMYTCIAKNHNGFEQKSINITVVCCAVQNEMKNTTVTVIVSISVITVVCILLGVTIMHTKGKLKSRRQNERLRNSGLGPDTRVQRAVQNPNYSNHLKNEISGTGHNAQVHIRVGKADNRFESSDGYVNWQGNTVLNYAEIDFTPGSPESRFVIHGNENVTKYSDIVLPVASTSVVLNE